MPNLLVISLLWTGKHMKYLPGVSVDDFNKSPVSFHLIPPRSCKWPSRIPMCAPLIQDPNRALHQREPFEINEGDYKLIILTARFPWPIFFRDFCSS